MRKLFFILIVAICGGVLVLLMGANFFLDVITRQLLAYVPKYSSETGIQIYESGFEKAEFSSIKSICWSGVKANLRPRFQGEFTAKKSFDVTAGRFCAESIDFSFTHFVISAGDLHLRYTRGATAALLEESEPLALAGRTGRIEARTAAVRVPLDIRQPMSGVRKVIGDIKDLMKNGRVEADLEFAGRYTLLIGESTEYWLGVEVRRAGSESTLFVNPADLAGLRSYFIKLTDAEIALLERHPHRASALAKQKYDAEQAAKVLFVQDPVIGENLYRQAAWSYWLTRQFGPDFAKKVTDANQSWYPPENAADAAAEAAASAMGRKYGGREINWHRFLKDLRGAKF